MVNFMTNKVNNAVDDGSFYTIMMAEIVSAVFSSSSRFTKAM